MEAANEAELTIPSLEDSSTPDTLLIFPHRLGRKSASDFVGPNFEKYWRRWSAMDYRRSRISWNWPAFFLGPVWLGYRRMHVEALVVLTLQTVAAGIFMFLAGDEDAALAVSVVFDFAVQAILSLYANFLYFRRAGLADAAAQKISLGDQREIARYGGTSLPLAMAWSIGSFLVVELALSLAGSWLPNNSAQTSQGPEVTTPTQQNDVYFSEARFRNPYLMRSLFEQTDSAATLPVDARLVNAFYVKYGIDRVTQRCGWKPSGVPAIAKGTLDIGEGVILSAHTIKSISEITQGNGTNVMTRWLQGINSFDMIKQYAWGDMDQFLSDHQTCSALQVRALTDGFNWYLVWVAPKILQ